jgi:hypothetical protein
VKGIVIVKEIEKFSNYVLNQVPVRKFDNLIRLNYCFLNLALFQFHCLGRIINGTTRTDTHNLMIYYEKYSMIVVD